MSNLIGDDDLLVVEKEAYSGNVTSIFYFIGGLVERGRIEEAQRHTNILVEKGYSDANAALGEHLYLYQECPAAVADLSDDQRFNQYLNLTAPYAASERPGATVAAFDIGNELDNRERHAEALPWFVRAAERGHEEAAIALGYAFTKGLGTAVNVLEGARWFMRSLDMEPVDSIASDQTKWPVSRENGWVDWMMFEEMAKSLNDEERIELMQIVSKPIVRDSLNNRPFTGRSS